MLTTTLPAQRSACSWAVVAAESHGVAITTMSHSAAASLSPTSSGRSRSGHWLDELVAGLHRPVLRPRADARRRSRPTPAGRRGRCPPAPCHRRCRSASADMPSARTRPAPSIGPVGATSGRTGTSVARHGAARRKEHRGHRRPHRRVAGVRRGQARPSRRAPRSCSPAPGGRCSLTERTARKLPDAGAGVRARRHRCPSTSSGPRRSWRAAGAGSTACCTRRLRARGCLGDDFMAAVGRRVGRAQRLGLLAEDAGRRLRAAHDRRRRDRRPRLRHHRGVAGLQLDGRGQGGAASRRTATWPRSSARKGIRVQPGGRRPGARRWRPSSIPGFAKFEDVWDDRAPLGWDVNDLEPVAKACVALLSTGSRRPPAR